MAWVMDQLTDQIDSLHQTFVASEQSRSQVDAKLDAVGEAIIALTEKLDGDVPAADALLQVAQGQERLVGVLEQQAAPLVPSEDVDAEARMHLRSIDLQMLRILEELSAGRQESTTELRTDLRTLIEVLQNTGADIRRLRSHQSGQE